MKLSMAAPLLVVGALLLPVVDSTAQLSPDQVAARAKAAYEAAMRTVASSQESWLAAQASTQSPKQNEKVQSPAHFFALPKVDLPHQLDLLRHKEQEEHSALETANERAEELEDELSRTRAELDSARAARKSLHDKNSEAASNAALMMRDMHSTLADERAERIEAERNATEMTKKLMLLTKNERQTVAELAEYKAMILQKQGHNANLTAALDQAHLETEHLRHQVELLKKTSTQKADQLSKELEQVRQIESAEREELKKTKVSHERDVAKLKAELKKQVGASKSLWDHQKAKAFKLFSTERERVKNLTEENTNVKMHFVKHHKFMKKMRERLTKTNEMLKSEHTAFMEAKSGEMKAEKQVTILASKLRSANKQVISLKELEHKSEVQNAMLKKGAAKKNAELKRLMSSLHKERGSFSEAQYALKENSLHLMRESSYKVESRKRLRKLWEALKAKKTQLKLHDELLAHVQRRLHVAELHEMELAKRLKHKDENRERLVRLDYIAKLKEEDLESLRTHAADVAAKEMELRDAHAKLAAAQDSLQGQLDPEAALELAKLEKHSQPVEQKPTADPQKQDRHEEASQMTDAQLDVSQKELEDSQDQLKALNDQLAKDESNIASLGSAPAKAPDARTDAVSEQASHAKQANRLKR